VNGQTRVNGTKRPDVPILGAVTPIRIGGMPAEDQPETAPAAEEARSDLVAEAEAARIRALTYAETEAARVRAEAEAEARRIEAEGAARAAEILATEEAEAKRITNERSRRRLEKEQADHELDLAEKAAKKTAADAAREKSEKAAEEVVGQESARAEEQQRSEALWKWGARGIYLVGLAIAAPVQFLDFWDPKRPFLVSAPILLEGLALVLAAGAAWAVAHRRDVAPYRVGIMLGAMIAATINLRGGLTNAAIGFNAGLIGAIASLGGPIVLMAYEHGIAQKADGIPSWRETRAADKEKDCEAAAKAKAKAERDEAARKAAADKEAQRAAAEAEQQRKDADRKGQHEDVWKVADALRSARGSATVTEQIWGEAWLLVTGSKHVGITPEIEALSRDAMARMKDAADSGKSQVESQMSPRVERDPNTPDARRFNGGNPPRRTPGDTAPYHPVAKAAAAETARRTAVTATVSDTSRKDA
jgi:hypothetical protein